MHNARSVDQATGTDPLRRHAPLFASALAALSREGFWLPPQDSIDVVRDFFSEEWSKLEAGYDPAHPSHARFETYLFVAFKRFARKRIVRLRRWYGRIADAIEIRQIAAREPEPGESGRDLERVREAIALLPEPQRAVLLDYLSSPTPSERALARAHGMNRYRLRETLIDALGGAAIRIGEKGCIDESDWQVALSLWRDGRDAQRTADYLGRSLIEVQESRGRIFERLAAPLRTSSRSQRKEGGRMDPTLTALIEKALASEGNQSLLAEIRKRANELGEALDSVDSEEIALDQLGAALRSFIEKPAPNLDWASRVFAALAGESAEVLGPADRADEELLGTREAQVAEAFDLLVSDLPGELELAKRLKELPPVSMHIQSALRARSPRLRASEVAHALPTVGMSPLTVFEAARSVPELAERIVRFETAPGRDPFLLRRRKTYEKEKETLAPELYIEEIAEVSPCSRDAAELLYDWLFDVASVRRFVFFGYQAIHTGNLLRLLPLEQRGLSLLQAWGSA